MGYQAPPVKMRPFAIAFTNPWLIVGLTIAGFFIALGLLGSFIPGFN
jgi:hypothetical protein